MPTRIELLGLPAAGKTTLLESLSPVSRGANLQLAVPLPGAPSTLRERWDKCLRDCRSVFAMQFGAPIKASSIWRACESFKQPSVSEQIRLYLNCLRLEGLTWRYVKVAHEHDAIAFDQGLFQAIWSLALNSDIQDPITLERAARQLLRVMTKPHLVIFVDTSPVEVQRRLELQPRGHGRLPDLIREDPNWIDRASECLQLVWRICRQQADITTLRLSQEDFDLQELLLTLTHWKLHRTHQNNKFGLKNDLE